VQPTTPGMLIDGVFVPASNSCGSQTHAAAKHPEMPSLAPPTLEDPPQPPAKPRRRDSTPHATAEQVLQAANSVAYLPEDSELLVPDTPQKKMQKVQHGDHTDSASKWLDLQSRQDHADKLYKLLWVCTSPSLLMCFVVVTQMNKL
jgi:hypothetical protein